MALIVLTPALANDTDADADEVMALLDEIIAQVNGNLEAINLADAAVTAAKMAALSVGTAALQDDAVTSAKAKLTTVVAPASSSLTLGVTMSDVPGCTFTAPANADYMIWGVFQFSIDILVANSGCFCEGELLVNGVHQPGMARFNLTDLDAAGSGEDTAMQVWVAPGVLAGQVIKLRAMRTDLGAGGSNASAVSPNTKLVALQHG